MLVFYWVAAMGFFQDGVLFYPLGIDAFEDILHTSKTFHNPLKRRIVYIPVVVKVINIQALFTAG